MSHFAVSEVNELEALLKSVSGVFLNSETATETIQSDTMEGYHGHRA